MPRPMLHVAMRIIFDWSRYHAEISIEMTRHAQERAEIKSDIGSVSASDSRRRQRMAAIGRAKIVASTKKYLRHDEAGAG